MKMKCFTLLFCIVVAAASVEKRPPHLREGEAELFIEAVFNDIALVNDTAGGQSGDGAPAMIEELKIDYSEETKKNIDHILDQRIRKLTTQYCGSFLLDLHWFAHEHGPLFGVTNETVPNFDAYDVAQRIMLEVENGEGRSDALDKTLAKCRETLLPNLAKGITKKQQTLWILGCVSDAKRAEAWLHTGKDVHRRWSFSAKVDTALDGVGSVLACPREMTKLALVQLDVEYKRDGVRKAHAAGALSKERMETILSKSPVPTRADSLRILAQARIDDNIVNADKATTIEEEGMKE